MINMDEPELSKEFHWQWDPNISMFRSVKNGNYFLYKEKDKKHPIKNSSWYRELE